MDPQILWIIGIVLTAIGVVCIGLAVFVFFKRDVRGVQADLSGKKRQQAVEDAGKAARRSRRKTFTGSLNTDSLEERTPATPTEEDLYTSVVSAVEAGAANTGDIEDEETTDEIVAEPTSDLEKPAFEGDDAETSILQGEEETDQGAIDTENLVAEDGEQEEGDESASEEPDITGDLDAGASETENIGESAGAPVAFTIVRKIVLRESTQVIEG